MAFGYRRVIAGYGRCGGGRSPADRAAIRAHIDRIFQAFIHKNSAELRATHAANWLGYLEGSRTMIRGVDGRYWSGYFEPGSPYGMTGYKMREFDMIFQGDAAFVAFVADVEAKTPNGPYHRTLRITDFYTKQNGAWIQTGSDTDLHPESMAEQQQMPRKLSESERKRLLDAREAVWRAYFAGDRAALEKLLPEELIHPGIRRRMGIAKRCWMVRRDLRPAAASWCAWSFRKPRFSPMAPRRSFIRATFTRSNRAESGRSNSGRVTEVFVNRNGAWVNPSWHMDTVH